METDNIDEVLKQLDDKPKDELKPLTVEEHMAIECIKKISNPFRTIGVNAVMKDLHIGKNNAYRVFRRADFPALNVGKVSQVMVLSYILWKMKRRD